ncbi:hypothetical protein [Puia dinghuensis]|uniref:Uncharacterized protein n=1 Tax=Puia dinghuensis TaxID=1792502 RepID=A0A8J2UDI4_9BACT|nr:hypothetical protein [Puia dinghuensis]GGB01086.1 hypothetical protein GCM10011511_25520 [Puia dinghuensis]
MTPTLIDIKTASDRFRENACFIEKFIKPSTTLGEDRKTYLLIDLFSPGFAQSPFDESVQ